MDLTDPNALVIEASAQLDDAGVANAVYGGLALAIYGNPRETKATDSAVLESELELAVATIISRFPGALKAFKRQQFGGLHLTRLSILPDDCGNDSGFNTIDFIVPFDSSYTERALHRAVDTTLRGRKIRVLAPEDYVIYKLLSTRDSDIDDAASVIQRSGAEINGELLA